MSYLAEDLIVLRSMEVASQLKEHGARKRHNDAGDNNSPHAGQAEGREVLHDFLASGKTSTDEEANKGQRNGQDIFQRHGCLIALLDRR